MTNTEDYGITEFEQFRRAYQDGDETALTHIYKKYLPLLIACARRHSMFHQSSQDAETFARTALSNFYRAVKGEKFTEKFSEIPRIIVYLYSCVHTAIAEDVRNNQSLELPEEETIAAPVSASEPSPEPSELLAHIDQLLTRDDDRSLTRLRFVLEMKPAEISRLHPEYWSTPREVSISLQRIRRRLRADPMLCELAGLPPEDDDRSGESGDEN